MREKENINWSEKTILVVEDDEFNFLIVQEIFKETKAKILWTKSGKEAISFLKNEVFIDFILMDYNLPCINGVDTVRQLLHINPELAIIGLTSYEDCKEEFIKSGAKGFILKPLTKEKLMQLSIIF